jgi:hypothetical protein
MDRTTVAASYKFPRHYVVKTQRRADKAPLTQILALWTVKHYRKACVATSSKIMQTAQVHARPQVIHTASTQQCSK